MNGLTFEPPDQQLTYHMIPPTSLLVYPNLPLLHLYQTSDSQPQTVDIIVTIIVARLHIIYAHNLKINCNSEYLIPNTRTQHQRARGRTVCVCSC